MADAPLDPRTTVGHAHLRVADLDRALEFYREALGFREAWRDGGTVMLSADGRYPFALGLAATAGPAPQGRRGGLYHAAFLLPGRAALGRLLRRLLERDVLLDGASDHLVSEALYLRDPDGNGVELYADRPPEQWIWNDDQVDMTTRDLDLRDLLAAGGDRSAPAPEGTRLGHVHLRVSDLGRAEAFYHKALGFDVTLRRYPGALFMAAGRYHHHLGTNVWAGQGIPPAATTGPGLAYFTISLPGQADLTGAIARLASHGITSSAPADYGPCLGAGVYDLDGIRVILTVDHAPLPDQLAWRPAREPFGAARAT
ncbi:MAG TPA: VOC family protein [bacterium]|nr:VOC family protein [bacterium]